MNIGETIFRTISIALVICMFSCTKKADLTNPVDANIELKVPLNLRVESITEGFAIIKFSDPNYNSKYPSSRIQFIIERDGGDGFKAINPTISFADTLVTIIDSAVFNVNTAYSYRVLSQRGNQKSSYTPIASGKYAFNPPADLSVIFSSETYVNLTWMNTNSLAIKTIIEKSSNGTTFTLVDSISASMTTKSVIGIYSSDTTYYYRLKYISDVNQSSYTTASNKIIFNSPSNFNSTYISETNIRLTWSNNNNYAMRVIIDRSSNGLNYESIDSVSINETTKDVAGIYSSDTTYYFRIKNSSSINASNYSIVSSKLSFASPSKFQIVTMDNDHVDLKWINSNNYASTIDIEQSTNNELYNVVKSVGTQITNTTLEKSFDSLTTYYFRVRAKSKYNASAYSNIQSYNILKNIIASGLVFVAGGIFSMGGNDNNRIPVHTVNVPSFSISNTEIRWNMWDSVVSWGKNNGYTDLPVGWKGSSNIDGNHPVTSVSWYQVIKWCNARSEKEGLTPAYYTNSSQNSVYRTGQIDLDNSMVKKSGKGYRLPTEAEWEYAARGGINSKGFRFSGTNAPDTVAWWYDNSNNSTHPVGTKAANELNLFDLSGNVWEWVEDMYHTDYNGAPNEGSAWYGGSNVYNNNHVVRGGSYRDPGGWGSMEVNSRWGNYPPNSSTDVGFRVAKTK